MRTTILLSLTLVLCAGLLVVGCKSDTSSTAQGEAGFYGTVVDGATGSVLSGASVTASSITEGTLTQVTDANGNFAQITFKTDSTVNVNVTVQKSGYNDTTFLLVLRSATVAQLTIRMSPKSVIVPPGGGTGLAQTIAFLGASPQELRVYGVGGQETSILSWEVRDSLGLPIDAGHSVVLNFSLVSGPGGGEYVSPPSFLTNSVGRAYTTFNAGIRAGVTQVVATATVSLPGGGTRTIQSSPVRVIMDGGFPVQSHFSISAANYNFPALHWQNRRDVMQVLVGDIYSNPVAPNTAVYFHTSPYPAGEYGGAGVVQPTVYTDKDGLGTVSLISGSPAPIGVSYADQTPTYGDGYHFVVARTIGQGGAIVTDSVRILWSGYPFITNLNPTSFSVPNGGSLDFTFTVSDELGHPLAAGTTIAVTATVPPPPDPNTKMNQVQVGFGLNGSVTLPDIITGGTNRTNFSFRLSDGTSDFDQATAVLLTISVAGPNGTAIQFINGTVR
jgi:hypothetical protein